MACVRRSDDRLGESVLDFNLFEVGSPLFNLFVSNSTLADLVASGRFSYLLFPSHHRSVGITDVCHHIWLFM